MKYLLAILAAISMLSDMQGSENMNKAKYGYQKYGKKVVDSVEENGSIILEGTKVLGLAKVNGSFQAVDSEINSLLINGQVDLNNSLIANKSVINGSLNANNAKFQKNLSIAAQKIVLNMCTVDSLTIREVKGYTGSQIVDLRRGTTVTGPIVFEANNGEIWISPSSNISEAQVSGARIHRK